MKNYLIIFGLGAFSYGLIEIVWRGYSHWSMMLAGGLCFVAFSVIEQNFSHIHILYKGISGSIIVTVVELVFGTVFNLMLGLDVWNYNNVPFNFLGQVCVLYSVLWGFLSAAAIPFAGKVLDKLDGGRKESRLYETSAQSVGGN